MSLDQRSAVEASPTTSDPRWASVAERDSAVDDTFFYSVATTGVYCRPSCSSRLAKPENVAFHNSREEAEQAGFRPCKRCKPDEPALAEQQAAAVAKACRLLARSERVPALKELAAKFKLSPSHFHRIFKSVTGVTPHAFFLAQRAGKMQQALRASDTVTDAIYSAGFSSSGRFYAATQKALGMTPTAFRAGGLRAEIRFAVGECSLGSILVAQSEKGVCAILLGDDPAALIKDLEDRFPQAALLGGEREFEDTVAQVVALVEDPARGLHLPLELRGTVFQQRVWQALRKLKPGEKVSYTDLAQRVGLPQGARAVARACAANPLAVAIPCHRVVRSDGALSGYRWGLERKRALLQREAKLPL